jgi:hypothetical protein
VACGGGQAGEGAEHNSTGAAAPADQVSRDDAPGRPAPVIETGCLTGDGDRFVLTELQSAADASGGATAARTTTATYQLIGNEDELRKHVGREVRISGEAPPPQVAELRESTPGTAGTTGEQSGQARVNTATQTRLEVAQLRVQSVTPTGDDCAESTRGTDRGQ